MVLALKGLRSDLTPIKDQILASSSIPSLIDVLARLLRIGSETIETNNVETSILDVKNENPQELNVHQRGDSRNSRPYCNYCNRPGHTRQSCWKLHDRPPRTNNRSTTHMVQNHKDTDGQLVNSITLSGADYSDYLQYQAATRQSPLSGTSQNGNFVACLTRSSPTCPWILDSSASDHISGNKNLFSNIIHSTTLSAVTLANGSTTAVNGIGDVQLLPSISLNSILFAPECSINLISISKLTKHLNCGVTILADYVVVQDWRTGKTIGIGYES